MEFPTLSIVMPVYGVEKFIGKAIQSVISQTYTDWELNVINDGTNDKSREIAAHYAKKDKRIRIIDKKNGGLSDARNVGLSASSGRYVHFFDSDDWIEPDFYENLIDAITNSKSDLVISGYTISMFKGKDLKENYRKEILKNRTDNPDGIMNYISAYFCFAWNKLYRRDFLLNNRLEFEKGLSMIEDCEFISRVIDYHPQISYCDSYGYHYRVDDRKTLSRFFNNKLFDNSVRRVKCSRKIIEYLCNDSDIREESLNLIKFNVLRSLIHSLFAYTENISLSAKVQYIKYFLSENYFRIPKNIPKHLSFKEKLLWYSFSHNKALLTANFYLLKK